MTAVLTKQFQPMLSVEVEGVPAAAGLRLQSFFGNELMAGVDGFDLTLAVDVPGELGGTKFKSLFKGKRVTFCVNGHTFAGVVRGGGWVPEEGTLFLRVSSALGRLANASVNRSWVNKAAPGILTAILKGSNLEVDASRLATARYPKLPFAAQYAGQRGKASSRGALNGCGNCIARTAKPQGRSAFACIATRCGQSVTQN